jgi:hypothetical protein
LPVAAGKCPAAVEAGYCTVVHPDRFYRNDQVKSVTVGALKRERLERE